jgi:O-antigen/teichoic acid export membrane protein
MKLLLNKILQSQLFKISSLNGISVMVKIAGGLVSSKVIALFLGPAGLAIVGNFRNFLTSVDSFSTLGFQNGIIKYVAESQHDDKKLGQILSTIFSTLLAVIIVASLLLAGFSFYWSQWVFNGSTRYEWAFIVLAFSLPWYTGNLVLLSVLNGLGRYKQVIYINIWGNITGVVLSALIIWKFNVDGALLGLMITPLFMFIVALYLLKKYFTGSWYKHFTVKYSLLKGLLSYSYMSLLTALIGPVVYLSLRNMLIENYGMEEAGYWEAMNRISFFYMMFITTLLTVYFLPELSKSKSDAETKTIFFGYYKNIIPLFFGGLVLLYFMRDIIVKLVLTEDFMPTEDLFLWQLIGDFLKACSYILAFEFFAKKLTRAYIVTELLSFLTLYFSAQYFIIHYGSKGAVMAHALTFGIYLVILIIYFRKKLF